MNGITLHSGILNDREIQALCNTDTPMIDPFIPRQKGKPSYGLGSFGYDIRLGEKFLVADEEISVFLDPVAFPDYAFLEESAKETIEIPPHTQVLAESVETFHMPDDVFGLCFGKSTYARCGLLVNATPLEAGWKGVLTLELANLSSFPIRLHIGQGIAQIVFFRGERPRRTYAEKEAGGVYQGQTGVTLPR